MSIVKSFFLSVILSFSLLAQNQTPEFEKLTTRDGLMGRDVECIFQDSYGFMWFGTWKGINRYDGTEFRFYEIFPAHPRFVSSNFVSAIAEDSLGYLWIGSLRGLIRLDPFSGRTLTFLHNKNNPDTPSHDFVTSIYIDRENIIWFGTQGGGLNKLIIDPDGQNPKFSHFLFKEDKNRNIRNSSVYAVYENSMPDNDLLWIGTANGLLAFNKKNEQYKRYIHNPNDNTSLPSNEVSVIHEDKLGRLWIGTDDGFICSLNKTSKGNYIFNNYFTNTQSQINHIANADSHSLWIAGNAETGLINFDAKTGKVEKFLHDPENPKSINWNSIYALYKDCSGILWVGTEGALNYFNPKKTKFKQFLALPEIFHTQYHSRVVRDIYKSGNGNLWIAKSGYGLVCLNERDGSKKQYMYEAGNQNSLCWDYTCIIHEDRAGYLWIGTENGLDCFDAGNETFIHYSDNLPKNNSRYLQGDLINDIYEDHQGELWICTDQGIERLDRTSGRFINYLDNSNGQLKKTGYYTGTIYQDSKKRYWIGGRGLFQFYPEKHKIEPYFHQSGDSAICINEMVSTIYEDSAGNLWIGTSGEGLYRISPDGSLLNLKENNGFSGDYVMAILEDPEGYLWVSTYLGLAKVHPVSAEYKNYGRKDGLTNNYFQLRCANKDKTGEMYFGQIAGYTKFDPLKIKNNPNESKIVITNISVFDKKLEPEYPVAGFTNLVLPYNQNMLTFEYILLSFTHSRLNRYKYFLEGLDKSWVFADKRRFISYSSLPPGQYTFHVKGSNSDGVWNEDGATVKIIITPPWWRTWWAYSIYSFLFFSVILTGLHYDNRRRQNKMEAKLKRERELRELQMSEHRATVAELQAKTAEAEKEAEKEQMRSRIASDLHDEIGGNLSSIAMIGQALDKRLKLLGNEKERLRKIPKIARSTAESMRDIVWFVNPANDSLDKLLAKMRETANLMLEDMEVIFSFDIDKSNFKNDLNFRRNLFLLYKEILQNIVRHAKASQVIIKLQRNDKQFTLSVKDNGLGFNTKSEYIGNGLKNFQRRAKEMNGELIVSSEADKGTLVKLSLKIP